MAQISMEFVKGMGGGGGKGRLTRVGAIVYTTVDGTLCATLVAVVSFTGPWCVPIKESVVATKEVSCNLATLSQGDVALNSFQVLGNGVIREPIVGSSVFKGLVKSLQASLGHPLLFKIC